MKCVCCESEMKELGDVNYHSNQNCISCFRNICLSCGTITDIHTYSLDEEELINELDNYELQDSPIYKEIYEKCEKELYSEVKNESS